MTAYKIAPPLPRQSLKAPEHLSAEATTWWNNVIETYDLEPHHLKLLQAACEAWDRMQQARAALKQHGLTFIDAKGQPKSRPENAIEQSARIAFARLLRELDLDLDGPASPEAPRPPALRSNRK